MVHLDLKIQSCPDFPAKTRQEMLSCPVLSRGFQKFECLDLSWNQISEYLKVLTCLDMHLCCLALSWIHIFVSVSCLVSSRKVFKIFCLSCLVSSREFPVPTHPCPQPIEKLNGSQIPINCNLTMHWAFKRGISLLCGGASNRDKCEKPGF